MSKNQELEILTTEITRLLGELEGYFWDVYVETGYITDPVSRYHQIILDDKETWLFHGTRQLYYKICLFLELKHLPIYLGLFITKFGSYINDKNEVMKDRGPLFDGSEPSMIIHDDFRDFLSGFPEFQHNRKADTNKLKLILEHTHIILSKQKIAISNEPSIYKAVRWYIEIIYPETKNLNKGRFIKKFKKYEPDILVPEISSAIEYKFIRNGRGIGDYLDQLKTDADNYTGDPEYKFFYAVVYFEDKSDLLPEAFKVAVKEHDFPENWTIIAL